MNAFLPSLSGIPNFFLYAAIGAGLSLIFAVIYSRITGHDEIRLIRAGNTSAAIAYGGSLIGFALPLSKAIAQAASIADCVLWGVMALIVQFAAYGIATFAVKDLSARIDRGELAAAIMVAAISIMAGQLNAASMTYTPALGGVIEAL